jgi:hypothetical protein
MPASRSYAVVIYRGPQCNLKFLADYDNKMNRQRSKTFGMTGPGAFPTLY